MASLERFRIEVVYADPAAPFAAELDVPTGTTLRQAIERSGLLNAHPMLVLSQANVGIWGREHSLDTLVRPDDRVEIYRPLQNDAKAARRSRAARQAL